MEIRKRYVYTDYDNNTFTGDLVSMNDESVTIQNRSCETHKNSWGLYHIEKDMIQWFYPLEKLISGKRYAFIINDKNNVCEGILIEIIGRNETVRIQTDNRSITAFSLYCVKRLWEV
jgi:hypothetical protein